MTMTVESGLDGIAAAVACYEPSARQRQVARLRVADALFCYQLGRGSSVARVVRQLLGEAPIAPATVAFDLAACIRYTEADDLLLESCTSPGAIVVPSVIAVASMEGSLATADLLDAVVLGYGVASWLGKQSGGALAVMHGAWPSRAVAPVTAALCAGRALGLRHRDLAEAVALASIWRAEGRLCEPARELSFARAVSIGVEAAHAIACGVRSGVRPDPSWCSPSGPLCAGDSPITALDMGVFEARVKLFCAARQAMPALVAVNRALASAGVTRLDAEVAIDVELPAACAAMVDVAHVTTRLESLRSLQYQVAALLVDQEKLWDIERSGLAMAAHAEAIAPSVSIRSAEDLEEAFPAHWPARASVRAGMQRAVAVEHDLPAPLDAVGVAAKQRAFCGADQAALALGSASLDACERAASAADLWALTCFLAERAENGEGGHGEPRTT